MSNPEQRFVFDEVAVLYDRARPSYPQQLARDVLELARLAESDRILEVGCGTGQATRLFAPHGHRMTCLEPGAGLARLARENFADLPHIQILETTFEDWPVEEGAFALLISAQAFHWVKPEVRFHKSAQALAEDGAIALFWNVPAVSETAVHRAIEEQYARHAPTLGERVPGQFPPPPGPPPGPPPHEEIRASGLFGTVLQRSYPWQAQYDIEQFVALMLTHSNHRLLPEPAREALTDGIRNAISSHSGHVSVDYRADLYFARRG